MAQIAPFWNSDVRQLKENFLQIVEESPAKRRSAQPRRIGVKQAPAHGCIDLVRDGGQRQAGALGKVGTGHPLLQPQDRKSTRLNSSHVKSSYAVFCL